MSFKKAVIFTDLHLGKKNNSDIHNNDCLDYIDWMVAQAKEFGAETAICTGDFHDVRATINIKTMNYSIKVLEKLSAAFDKTYMILGNHDLFNKSSLTIHSLAYAPHIPNIHVIEKPTTLGNSTFIPWIADNDYTPLSNAKSPYVFAHLELPNFYMNSQIRMPDHNQANAEMFNGPEYIFSGHFHKRQIYKNKSGSEIIYLGNCFPHNYSDINDTSRGCVLLEHGKEPIFVDWEDCPKYKIETLSNLLETPEDSLSAKTYMRVQTDMDLPYDEINFIRDTLQKQFNAREIIILPKKSDELLQEYNVDVKFESVDHIVLTHIDALDTETFDKALLSSIYLGLN